MSNAFDDLWNSSASKPAPPRTLGSSPSIGNTSTRTSNHDAFAALASAGGKSPSPGITRTTTSSSSTSARTASTRPAGGVPLPGMTNGGDVFGNLLSGSAFAASNGSDTRNMTMAQRAAHAERTRLEMAKKATQAQAAQASAWSGLDSLGGGSSQSSVMASAGNGFDDFLAPTSTPAASQSRSSPKVTPQADDWGLDDAFLGKPSPAPSTQSASPAPRSSSTQPSAPPKGGSLWDMDEFLSDKPAPPPRTSSGRSDKLDVVGDFDFGDREDRSRNETPENDDFLGVLSLPVSQVASRPSSTQPSRATSSPRPTTNGNSRTGSPPPHVIGQIVEMGFTPQQARIALAATDSGIDVQQALDALLAQTVPDVDGSPSDERSRQPFADSDDETSDARRRREARYNDPDDELPPIAPRRRQPEQPRRDSGRERADGPEGPSVQDQADKYIAQASDIGISMFNSAKSFWSQGKEKVQKALEERIAANVSPAGSASGAGERNGQRQPPKKDGRPKWMQEAAERDDGDWGLEAPGPSRAKVPLDDATPPPPRTAPEKNAPPFPEGDLFSSEAPAAYVSPFRRKATPAAASPAPAIASSSSTSARSKPQRMGSSAPAAMVERATVTASTSAIATSTRHKEAGTAAFKLGQYADAATGYTQALDALPDGHLLRVPLWNNRALARIRSGDYSGALEDSNAAVELIGLRYNPALEKKVDQPEHGAGVDLADGLVKGLRRRAEAAEGREKWADARKDWELLAGLGWAPAKTRSEAVAGAGRCRKAENPAPPKPAAPAASDVPRVKARPKTNPRRPPSPPGEALQRVQAANRAQEAEDDAKHALKDTVDAKLLAWKGNKETNVRALLGSLDTVLWPELNMPKVGMNQLITEKQVKIQYTKAIARLHPDKLNVHNTTLEQRMIANGVFAALNEAWIAFKP